MIRRKINFAILILAVCLPVIAVAQQKKKIRLIQAEEIRYDRKVFEDIQILSGNVVLEHDSVFLYCDSAYLNEVENSVQAFSNIHIEVNDTLNLFGDLLDYSGNTKIAEIYRNVRLVDNQTTLYTDHLYYDRNSNVCYYLENGKIVNEEDHLTSKRGYYYPESREFYFHDDVVLLNPEYTIRSDTLKYTIDTEVAWFLGPSTIESDDDFIYCENGWYDTRTDISRFGLNTYIITGDQTLEADSIYYEHTDGYGLAFGNITLTDTAQDIVLKGNFAEYGRKAGFMTITDSALAMLIDNADTLFLHADTLRSTFDEDQNAEAIIAYYHTKFFRNDLQGMCDSLYYDFVDSVINLYDQPVLWSEENQLTADSVKIWIKNRQVDQITLHSASFIISRDDSTGFNQIKGLNMTGYFTDNELNRIYVASNSETVYYVREEDGSLIGINKAVSGNMWIQVDENKIERVTYIDSPKATLYPEKDFPQEELKLKGFIWYEGRRPVDRFAIFNW